MYSYWHDNLDNHPILQTLSMRFDEFIMRDESIYQNATYAEF
jgi:hypothetical protein